MVNEWNKRVCPSFLTHYELHISRLLNGHVSCTISVAQLVNDLAQLEACKHVSLIMMGVVALALRWAQFNLWRLCRIDYY